MRKAPLADIWRRCGELLQSLLTHNEVVPDLP